MGVARARQQKAELGGADAGERVRAAQGLAQAGDRLGQELVGERLAHGATDGPQQLEVDAKERDRHTGAVGAEDRLVDAIGEQDLERQPGHVVEQRARLAGRVQLGDVLQDRDPEAALAQLQSAERGAELEALAALAPGQQLRAGAFAAHRQPQVVALVASEQVAERHARELLPAVAEHGLGGAIAGADDAVAVEGQDGGAAARGERRHQDVLVAPRGVTVLAGLAAGGRAREQAEAIGREAREQQRDGRQRRTERSGERERGPGGDQGGETEQARPPGQAREDRSERKRQQRRCRRAGAGGQQRDRGEAGGAGRPGRELLQKRRRRALQQLGELRQTGAIAGQADQCGSQNQKTHTAHRCLSGLVRTDSANALPQTP
jgi:hypothetical protein